MAYCLVPQASTSFQKELIDQVEKLKEEVKSKDRELAMKEKSLEEARRQKGVVNHRLVQIKQTIKQSRMKTIQLVQEKMETEEQLQQREQELQLLCKAQHKDNEKVQKIIRYKEEEIKELQQHLETFKSELIQEKNDVMEQLQLKKEELELLCTVHQMNSEQHKDIIRKKEEEIKELQHRLEIVETELSSEKKHSQDLRKELQQGTKELQKKSALEQKLEEENENLKNQLERERKMADNLCKLLTSADTSKDKYTMEVEVMRHSAFHSHAWPHLR